MDRKTLTEVDLRDAHSMIMVEPEAQVSGVWINTLRSSPPFEVARSWLKTPQTSLKMLCRA